MKKVSGVYFLLSPETQKIKIGYSSCIWTRAKCIQNMCPIELQCYYIKMPSKSARKLEGQFHEKFEEKRLHGEWFAFDVDIQKYIEHFCEVLDFNWTGYWGDCRRLGIYK